jgi:hypothetical protein
MVAGFAGNYNLQPHPCQRVTNHLAMALPGHEVPSPLAFILDGNFFVFFLFDT